jgi:hypothetical protein
MMTGVPAAACSDPVTNRLVISRQNQMLWNGNEIDRATLIRYLEIAGALTPAPWLLVDYETGANCGVVVNTFNSIRRTAKGQMVIGGSRDSGPKGRGCAVAFERYERSGGVCGPVLFYFLFKPDWLD